LKPNQSNRYKKFKRVFLLAIVVILGFVCLFEEFKKVKINLLFEGVFRGAFLLLFFTGTIIQLFNDIHSLRQTKTITAFLPSISLIVLWAIISIHSFLWSRGTTKFTAYTDDIDHGVLLDFRDDNTLQITHFFKFGEKIYLGKYSELKDTLILCIETDIPFGNKAIMRNDTLQFVNDTVAFSIERP
jgi:hypothetical protein